MDLIGIRFACSPNTTYKSDSRRDLIGIRFACGLNAEYKSDLKSNLFGIEFFCGQNAEGLRTVKLHDPNENYTFYKSV